MARVALAVLVFDTTRPALATAAAYAITMLPWLIGGPVLAGIGDRYPRRTVLITGHAASAVLVGLIGVARLPLLALCALLFGSALSAVPDRSRGRRARGSHVAIKPPSTKRSCALIPVLRSRNSVASAISAIVTSRPIGVRSECGGSGTSRHFGLSPINPE